MRATIVESSFGMLAFDDEKELAGKVLFPRNPQIVAKTLFKIESGKLTDEIIELIDLLQKSGFDAFVFESPTLANEARNRLGINVEVSRPSEAGEMFRSQTELFAIKTEFVKDSEGFSQWTHSVTMELAKLRIKGAVEKRDLLVAQSIQTLDDLDKIINLFMGRLREWYGIHFPELDRLVDKHETYARLVLALGGREAFTSEKLEREEVPNQKAGQIAKSAETSMGADLEATDLSQIQALSQNTISLYKLRQELESYLDKTMEEVAPNTKALVGSLLGARLIALAGGLTNLARKPASTIQVLGAEKALFRSLKTGTRPPKHGLIFQDTLLHEAKRWQRGKIARALAGKLAIAARADAFGGRHIGKELKAELDKRIKEIQEKYAEPPPIEERRPKPERPRYQREKFKPPGHVKKKWRKHRRER